MLLGEKRTTEGKAFILAGGKKQRWRGHAVMMQEIERHKQLKNERRSGTQIICEEWGYQAVEQTKVKKRLHQ